MENQKTEKCKKVLAGSNPKNFEHFIVRPVQSQIEKCPVTLTMSEENEKLRIWKIWKSKNPEKWKKVEKLKNVQSLDNVGNLIGDKWLIQQNLKNKRQLFRMVSKTFF